ncbi:P-loop containing nucleoside triphosphate hydrolase protein [Hyaloscypha variabilis]
MADNKTPTEQPCAANTEVSQLQTNNHAEPVIDTPLETANLENESNREKEDDKKDLSSQNDGKPEHTAAHPPLERTRSDQSTTTEKRATSSAYQSDEIQAPRKRTLNEKLNPFKRKHVPPVPTAREVTREYQAGLFSTLYFQWIAPLMSVGYQRPLELNDIWAVNPDRSVDVMVAKLKEALKRRKANPGKLDPLAMAVYDTFKKDFWIGGVCQLTASCMQVLSPFTLKYLIIFVEEAYDAKVNGGASPSIGRGVGLVVGITCMQMVQSLCMSQFYYRGMLVGGQVRSTLIACIFEKAMKLSGRAKAGGKDTSKSDKLSGGVQSKGQEEKVHSGKNSGQEKKEKNGASGTDEGWSNGRINNLMATDTSRIDLASGTFHRCWTSPIQVLLTLGLLCVNLTYSALVGFAFICVMMPLLGRATRSLMARRKAINKITDQRVQLTQEIFSSVRFVKFLGWESSFLDRLAKLRKVEVRKIFLLMSIRNGILSVAVMTPILASMLTFITYYLSNHVLNAAPIFSSLALFNALGVPLELLPVAIGRLVDANASVKRISDFLIAEEMQDEATWNSGNKDAITVDHASFTWEQNTPQQAEGKAKGPTKGEKQSSTDKKAAIERSKEVKSHTPGLPTPAGSSIEEEKKQPFQINDINLAIGRKELIAVIGSVGSGKSSLLSALAGDMRKTRGEVTFGSSRAFCPQYAWIQNTTVRQNVVFGRGFDENWYNTVIDACALRQDLDIFPSGDMTEIGERGITVSGGQKQRLNIARAIYFNADIVLMDDPLSAVDAHVGRHIMDNAICGLLRDKCRVLATHQLHVLHRVDRIVWMKDGNIYKVATFSELIDGDAEFQKLMETTAREEKTEKEESTDDELDIEEEKKGPKMKKAVALMQQEERAVGSVSWDIYREYIKASSSVWNLWLVIFLIVIAQSSNIATSLWLSWWTSKRFDLAMGEYIGVYAGLGVLQSILMFSFATTLTFLCTTASKVMLHRAISNTLRAPMSFFDTTPIGRIINRFSKDVDTMDNILIDDIRFFLYLVATITSVFCLTIAYYHYFVVALVPLTIAFLFAASYYRASARELKRYEAVLRSVVFSRFGEAVTGTSTIRAYGVQGQFIKSIEESLDSMDGAYFLTFANQRWLNVRLDTVGQLLIFTGGILIVASRATVSPSIGGLVLSYMLSIVQFIQVTVYQFAELQNHMNSTERIHYYGESLEQEAPLHVGEVRPSWPEYGEIVFSNVQMRYRLGLPLVLKGLSIHIKPGEHIGIVGRTGAGKSSIMSTLFRLIELSSGSISIDNIDISTIGLHDLRSRMTIIPQDPTLFRGTIRSNLDPFHEHQDLELWSALRQADLVDGEQAMSDKSGRIHLDTAVEDEGLNFSLGQRQLLALARALVRGSQIIVCDEATSSVDFETDRRIQSTMLRAFKDKTLLCIAHRLKSIIGYDRILVMDAGNVVELDSPLTLYDQGGIFRSMCDRSGIRREDFLQSDKSLI